jgi:hypothetical protein
MSRSLKARWTALAAVLVAAIAVASVGVTHAAFSGQTQVAGNVITAAPDFRGPNVSQVAVGKSTGGAFGSIRSGASYYVYANVTDVGSPASGVSTVIANVSSFDTGQVAVPLNSGSWTVNGQTFNRRSAMLTANTGMANGTRNYTVTATDVALNVTLANGSVTIDGTTPSATDVQTTNVGTAGRPEVGDSMTLTFSESMDPNSIMPGWDGSALTVIAGFQNAAGGDQFQVWNTDFDTQARFGTISMGRTDFTTNQLGFLESTMTMSGNTVTITLGGQVYGPVTTVGGTGTMRWTPSNQAIDVAGNAMSTTARNETGSADRDF